jgi:plasmid stabilization system protein ParE
VAKIIWTPAALRDIARLRAFLAPHGRALASRAVGTIRSGVKPLARFPKMGRSVEDAPPGFRDWFIPFGRSAYVVRYFHDGGPVTILAVRHGPEAGF